MNTGESDADARRFCSEHFHAKISHNACNASEKSAIFGRLLCFCLFYPSFDRTRNRPEHEGWFRDQPAHRYPSTLGECFGKDLLTHATTQFPMPTQRTGLSSGHHLGGVRKASCSSATFFFSHPPKSGEFQTKMERITSKKRGNKDFS